MQWVTVQHYWSHVTAQHVCSNVTAKHTCSLDTEQHICGNVTAQHHYSHVPCSVLICVHTCSSEAAQHPCSIVTLTSTVGSIAALHAHLQLCLNKPCWQYSYSAVAQLRWCHGTAYLQHCNSSFSAPTHQIILAAVSQPSILAAVVGTGMPHLQDFHSISHIAVLSLHSTLEVL